MDIPREDRLRGMKDHLEKIVYIIMFQEGQFLKERIHKLCLSFMEPM